MLTAAICFPRESQTCSVRLKLGGWAGQSMQAIFSSSKKSSTSCAPWAQYYRPINLGFPHSETKHSVPKSLHDLWQLLKTCWITRAIWRTGVRVPPQTIINPLLYWSVSIMFGGPKLCSNLFPVVNPLRMSLKTESGFILKKNIDSLFVCSFNMLTASF